MAECSGYGLALLIKDIEKPYGIEIGCDCGDTTEFLLTQHPSLVLFCVDPYVNYVDWNGHNLNERDSMYNRFCNRVKPFTDRVFPIRKTSDDAVAGFIDGEFDFVFIDALHTYEQVLKDCASYYSKVKDGGIFSGHDFTAIQGVHRAVKEFAAQKGKEILTTKHDVWYWIK